MAAAEKRGQAVVILKTAHKILLTSLPFTTTEAFSLLE